MPTNVEIKAKLSEPDAIARRVAELATEGPMQLAQDDTFFPCVNGRLKLRELSPTEGQLIFYKRPDEAGPRVSEYSIVSTSSPAELRETIEQALGVIGRVRKTRTLYMVGRTRVHLDAVQHLGAFIELEVVLRPNEASEAGVREAHELLERLAIPQRSLVSTAYIDLLASGARASSPGELPPQALPEPYVSLSTHTAPDVQPPRKTR